MPATPAETPEPSTSRSDERAREAEPSPMPSAVLHSEDRYRALVRNAPVGILYASVDGDCEYANPAMSEMAGQGVEELLGQGWRRAVHPDDRRGLWDHLVRAEETGERVSMEHRLVRPDGSEIVVLTHVSPVFDRSGRVTAYVGFTEDVSDRKTFEGRLRHQATHDALTGLPNRSLLVDRLDRLLIRRRSAGEVMLMFLDLDRFKQVNDVYGHSAGDELLKVVAERLKAAFREEDTIARFGGDEFVILAGDVVDEHAVHRLANRVVESLAEPIELSMTTASVSASVGVAVARPGDTAESLIRDADIAMYRAKSAGRDRFVVFDSQLRAHIDNLMALESDLERALEGEELEIHFQPKVATDSRTLVGVESLIRWRHPDRGLLLPAEFLPVAQEAGLMDEISDRVIRESCRQAAIWDAMGPPRRIHVSVNVSATELAGDMLFDRIVSAIVDFDLDPSLLCIEITEGMLVDDFGLSSLRIDALRQIGVRVALDDFGTGYSSLSYLSRLPVDEIKIDRSFVSKLAAGDGHPDAGRESRLVSAILGMAEIFALDVVAEGVETEEQFRVLADMGCPVVQGFLVAPALPHGNGFLEELVSGVPFELDAVSLMPSA